MSLLEKNTETISRLLQLVNELPSAGVELPELSNPADEASVVKDKEFIDADGIARKGTMPNNGAMSKTMDGVNTKSVSIPAGYTSGGTVSLDSTIDNAVASAISALTEKGVTVPGGTDVTGLADLIAAIESGGGGIECVTGTYTCAADMSGYDIYIDVSSLSSLPNLVVFYKEPTSSTTSHNGLSMIVNKILSATKDQYSDTYTLKANIYTIAKAATATNSYFPHVSTGASISGCSLTEWNVKPGLNCKPTAAMTFRYYAFSGVTL